MHDFPVGEFADSGQKYGGYAYNDALQTAKAQRVPIVYPRAGAVWRTKDGVTLTFIGPSLPFIQSNNTINDNSVAFILQYRQFRMLFTGDAGVVAEQRFLAEGIDLRAGVLKVGVGRHNIFGHPAPSTIETLKNLRLRVYRTDENGAASVVTDGSNEVLSTMLP